MPSKTRYPRPLAIKVARELCERLKSSCEQLVVAGSLRRRKATVGDIEILYVPKLEKVSELQQADLMTGPASAHFMNLAEVCIAGLLRYQVIGQRKNSLGSVTWGDKNKLAYHVGSQIPVDLFAATEANWFNYLVCRTGGAETNMRISTAAQAKGWKWNPYGAGFTDEEGNLVRVKSEEDVFRLAGLDYLEPWER